MIVKRIIDEDFCNYKKPAMLIAFPYCTFKCNKECGKQICQNSELFKSQNIKIKCSEIVDRYINNPITSAIVLGGLEPFDSWDDLQHIICEFRHKTLDDIVIYTGYTEDEMYSDFDYAIRYLKMFPNIIIKFGRFIPNQEKHFDEVLGVELASTNQYVERIS